MEANRHLFPPQRLGPVTVRNRVVFAAHLANAAVDGLPTAQHAAYAAARAGGGAGLVVTEESTVHPGDRPYEKLVDGCSPAVVPGHRRLTDAVHAHGTPVFAQLDHNGGQSSSAYTRRPVDAPSPVADPLFGEVPRALSTAGIAELVAGFATAAARCAAGGSDGVELQASQSSLACAFLAPATNRCTDGYGGPLEQRARFLLEVVAAVGDAVGPGLALGAAELDIAQFPDRVVAGLTEGHRLTVRLHHPTGTEEDRVVDWVVVVTHAAPADELWRVLAGGGVEVHRIGDCVAPPRAHAATVEAERIGVAL